MKNLAIIFLFGILLLACGDKEEPAPTATGTYTGTYSGYVSPQFVEGACTAEFTEKDGKLTGTINFSNYASPFSGTITGTEITGNITMSGFGGTSPFSCNGTITTDRKTIELSMSPAPVLNMKWVLTKD